MTSSIYDFEFTAINGKDKIMLSSFKGKLILVINTASLCGFTKQYAEIEKLQQKYGNRGLVIIAVPSNNFGNQEPATNDEIVKFCSTNFNISFILTAKTEVRGKDAHPFFRWVRDNYGWFAGPKWNFYKFFIATDGRPLKWFSSLTSPLNKKILNIIEINLPNNNQHD
jgi:glutathione peroxidase